MELCLTAQLLTVVIVLTCGGMKAIKSFHDRFLSLVEGQIKSYKITLPIRTNSRTYY